MASPSRRSTKSLLLDELRLGLEKVGCPAVLKTAGFGYDGKGQSKINGPQDVEAALQVLGDQEGVLEAFVNFEREVSVVAARGIDGAFAHYGVVTNEHHNHILDVTIAPGDVPSEVEREAVAITRAVLEALEVVGVMCVEFFLQGEGKLIINELAPRPHNSGHFTFDACITSQFEQQLRAVCGLPLGSPAQLRPAAMANLLGDLWQDGEPNWAAACAFPAVKLHLYGKSVAQPGRKMGHLTALAEDTKSGATSGARGTDGVAKLNTLGQRSAKSALAYGFNQPLPVAVSKQFLLLWSESGWLQ